MQTEETIPHVSQKPRKSKVHQATPELHKMANLPVVVQAFGREDAVKKFSLGQIAQSLAYVGTMQHVIKAIAEHIEEKGGMSGADVANIALPALSQSTYAMIGLLCVATSEPPEWIEDQDDIFGGMEILTAVVEKNADFFSPENIKRAKGLFARLQAAIPALSGIKSTPSSITDTDL